MSQFACISFEEDNIIVSKEKSFRYPHLKISLDIQEIAGIEGYKVNTPTPFKKCPTKYWDKLEKELLLRDVTYAYLKGAEKSFNPFNRIEIVTGDEVRPLLSSMILQYIYKYKLIEPRPYETKVGIITGRIHETVDLIANIKDEITDLTLYTKEPLAYKEVVQELNRLIKLRVRAVALKVEALNEMDIIFDLNGAGQYALGCNPKAIYIDYKNQTRRYMQQFIGPPPRIWYEFDIICRSQSLSVPFLQAVLYAQGLTHGLLRKEINNLDLTLGKVYTRSISWHPA